MNGRNYLYWGILGIVVVALVTVGVLVLRKRNALPTVVFVGGSNQTASSSASAPSDTKPIDSYVPARPREPGDPAFKSMPPNFNRGPEPSSIP